MDNNKKKEEEEGEGSGCTEPGSDWADLTRECLTNILSRLTLEQRWLGPMLVCKSWLQVCTDSSLHSTFDVEPHFGTDSPRWWTPDFERKIDSMLRSVVFWRDHSLTAIRTRHCSDIALSFAAERSLFFNKTFNIKSFFFFFNWVFVFFSFNYKVWFFIFMLHLHLIFVCIVGSIVWMIELRLIQVCSFPSFSILSFKKTKTKQNKAFPWTV